MGIKIKGTGSALPAKQVTNNDLAAIVDTNDEWIKERTGIESRFVSTGESVADLATIASMKALEAAGANAEDIDIIIVASCSPEMALPCVACQVQDRIGATKAVAFDLNAACAGFLFAMNTVSAYMESGIYKNALVIGAEVLSNFVDWEDRGTCILFGDGAGAVYVEKDANVKPMIFKQQSDGSKGMVLKCDQRMNKNAFYKGEEIVPFVTMDGREVFKFATRQVPAVIKDVMEMANVSDDDIDYYLLHQANIRIIEMIAKRLNSSLDKYPTNAQRVGNTSSASIPILLDECVRSGKVKEGMKIILSGFGAGLTYSAALVEM